MQHTGDNLTHICTSCSCVRTVTWSCVDVHLETYTKSAVVNISKSSTQERKLSCFCSIKVKQQQCS